ncbi:MAG: hypothetical protein IPG91_16980 [Ideonella sp.]|nr:hypothetical protein [Ideonella sp.]
MTEPWTAAADRIGNIEARTGGTCAAIGRLVAVSGSAKVCVPCSTPLERRGLECANAHARGLHEALMIGIATPCVFEPRTNKGRARLPPKRFAALCEATQAAIEFGLSARCGTRDQATP